VTLPGGELVSVVMIFRDAATFIAEAIDSVLGQVDVPIELLLCDDGSSDWSTEIARSRAYEHPTRVRYVEHPGHAHRGMSATRNLGIAAARGDLVAFLDADDVWQPGHLIHEVSLLRSHPEAAMVCGRSTDWNSWLDPHAHDVLSPLPWPPGSTVPPPRMLLAVLSSGGFATPMCSLLVRAHALRDVGGSHDDFVAMYEDQVLLAKLYLTQTCVISDAASALYRQHPGSSSAVAMRDGSYHPERPNRSEEAFLRWLEAHLSGTDGPEIDEIRSLVAARLTVYGPTRGRASRVGRGGRLAAQLAAAAWRGNGSVGASRAHEESFLATHRHAITGHVLAATDDDHLIRRLGGCRVTQTDVVRDAGDWRQAVGAGDETYDCIVLTRLFPSRSTHLELARNLYRILRTGGTLLLVTSAGAELAAAVQEVFGPGNVDARQLGLGLRARVAGRESLTTVRAYRPAAGAAPKSPG
jgi:glycosyltransferase involved in cell wall biosynthesis